MSRYLVCRIIGEPVEMFGVRLGDAVPVLALTINGERLEVPAADVTLTADNGESIGVDTALRPDRSVILTATVSGEVADVLEALPRVDDHGYPSEDEIRTIHKQWRRIQERPGRKAAKARRRRAKKRRGW